MVRTVPPPLASRRAGSEAAAPAPPGAAVVFDVVFDGSLVRLPDSLQGRRGVRISVAVGRLPSGFISCMLTFCQPQVVFIRSVRAAASALPVLEWR